MKRLALASLLAISGLVACERHDFEGEEGTKRLHEHHADHVDDHEDKEHASVPEAH